MSRNRHRRWMRRRDVRAAALAGFALLIVLATLIFVPGVSGRLLSRLDPDRVAIRSALRDAAMAELRPGYAARYYKPIWINGRRASAESAEIVDRLGESGLDGLSPAAYRRDELAARLAGLPNASRTERARTELLLTRSLARFSADLHAPLPAADLAYTDPEFIPYRPTPRLIAYGLATSRSRRQGLAAAVRMNPLYVQYREALAKHLAAPGADPSIEQLLRVNLERARALPADPGARFVLVDAAAGQLWLYENGAPVDSMKVVVGTPQDQTPAMAALIRYVVFQPNWNVPPDLTRDTYAPRIRANRSALQSLSMDVWSDHTREARKLDPAKVDWDAVARGSTSVWLRQRPGGQNAMGEAKFMLPNELGIYLHDTPSRELFAREQRTFSAGCIRVEDYRRLARWLYRGKTVGPVGKAPEQRVDLPVPVPVYIGYFTAAPGRDGVVTRPDVYSRDGTVVAALQAMKAAGPGGSATPASGDIPSPLPAPKAPPLRDLAPVEAWPL